MPKVKEDKFPPVRVSKELLKETKMFAEDCEEYLSDYIRKAVEMRNSKHRADVEIGNKAIEHAVKERDAAAYIRNHNTAKHVIEATLGTMSEGDGVKINTGKLEEVLSAPQKHPKPDMVKSFAKGGK